MPWSGYLEPERSRPGPSTVSRRSGTFPSGATLSFGHLQHERDRYNYQGGAYQFIGFDELAQFTSSQYLYLFSRLRRLEGASVPLRMRAGSNPGGEGHDWVRQRFLVERDPRRAFLPAKLADNPYLDQEAYRDSLSQLHPFERQQLLDGDWDVRPPGARFRREWLEIVEEAPLARRRVRGWDLAATEAKPGKDPDWTVGVLQDFNTDTGMVTIHDVQRFRGSPGTVEARLKTQAHADGPTVTQWVEQEGGSSGKIAARSLTRALAGYPVRFQPSTGDKIVRGNPFCSYAEQGLVRIVRGPWIEEYLREMESIGTPTSHDDQWDATSLGFSKLVGSGVSPGDLYGTSPQAEATP